MLSCTLTDEKIEQGNECSRSFTYALYIHNAYPRRRYIVKSRIPSDCEYELAHD